VFGGNIILSLISNQHQGQLGKQDGSRDPTVRKIILGNLDSSESQLSNHI
jgi:hypothetical protein